MPPLFLEHEHLLQLLEPAPIKPVPARPLRRYTDIPQRQPLEGSSGGWPDPKPPYCPRAGMCSTTEPPSAQSGLKAFLPQRNALF